MGVDRDGLIDHVKLLRELGLEVAQVIGKRHSVALEEGGVSYHKIANVVWTGYLDLWTIWHERNVSTTCSIYAPEDLLSLLVEDTNDSIVLDSGRLVLRFWLSHIGKLAKNDAEVGAYAFEGLWAWMFRVREHLAHLGVSTSDSGPLLRLGSRAIRACLNGQSTSWMETRCVSKIRFALESGKMGLLTREILSGIFFELGTISEACMSSMIALLDDFLKGMPIVIPLNDMFPKIERWSEAVTRLVVSCNQDGFERAISTCLHYTVCPHPLYQEMMAEFWMQLEYQFSRSNHLNSYIPSLLESLVRRYAASLAVSEEYKSGHSRLVQVRNIYAAILPISSKSYLGSLEKSLKNITCDNFLDRCVVAEYVQIQKALALAGIKDVDHEAAAAVVRTATEAMQIVIEQLNKGCIKSRGGVSVLLAWLADVVRLSVDITSGGRSVITALKPFCDGLILAMNQITFKGTNKIPLLKMVETIRRYPQPCFLSLARKLQDQIHSEFSLGSPAASAQILAAGLLKSMPHGQLRSMFNSCLAVEDVPAPLKIAAMESYIEYIRYCPKENIMSVLPSRVLDNNQGSISQPFKYSLENFIRKNKINEASVENDFTRLRFDGVIADLYSRLNESTFSLPPREVHQCSTGDGKVDSCTNIDTAIQRANDVNDFLHEILRLLKGKAIAEDKWTLLRQSFQSMEQSLLQLRDLCIGEE